MHKACARGPAASSPSYPVLKPKLNLIQRQKHEKPVLVLERGHKDGTKQLRARINTKHWLTRLGRHSRRASANLLPLTWSMLDSG